MADATQETGNRLASWQSATVSSELWPAASGLVRARVSSILRDNLLVLDSVNRQVHVLGQPNKYTGRDAARRATQEEYSEFETATVELEGGAASAVLPMRLNGDAIDDLTVLIVDDNSPDGTGALADQLAAENPGKLFVLHRPGKQGLPHRRRNVVRLAGVEGRKSRQDLPH